MANMADDVTKSYQREETRYLKEELDVLNTAAATGQVNRTWAVINKIAGKNKANNNKVRKSDGTQIKKHTKDLLSEWQAYFKDLLNAEPVHPLKLPDPAEEDLPINTDPISREEIEIAIRRLKSGKAAGLDNSTTPDILKYGGSFMRETIHTICSKVFSEKIALSQLKTNLIIPIPKKDINLTSMSNYRGITLMSVAAKIYNRVLLDRIRPIVGPYLRNNQAEVIVKAIRILYDGSKSAVLVEGELTKEFPTDTGILQGDVLDPFLFVIVTDYVLSISIKDSGFTTHPRRSSRAPAQILSDLEFADDIALCESTLEGARSQLLDVSEAARSTWILTKHLTAYLNSYHTNCLRIILVIKRLDNVTNTTLYNLSHQSALTQTIQKRQLRWVGHILRKPTNEPLNIYALYPPLHGRRKQGRQRLLYPEYIGRLVSPDFLLSPLEIRRIAQDRREWEKLVSACCAVD
ncbi:uncharacterized protein [Asterias amurensis]|uniref:uncharacterized protein n=1 Tax=Asterias amurensis TaxID=7602 RepID=UPI003AB7184D